MKISLLLTSILLAGPLLAQNNGNGNANGIGNGNGVANGITNGNGNGFAFGLGDNLERSSANNTSAPVGYEFFLDQRNLEGDSFIRTSVIQEDSMTSPMAVPEGGSEFTLWAVSSLGTGAAPIWTLIESEVVGAYIPRAQIEIVTGDPYNQGIPRTRVDQPFTLNYSVQGLEPGNPESPVAARKVIFDDRISTTLLTDTVLEPDASITPALVSQGEILTNGTESQILLANLPGDDIYAESGIETFTINALPDGLIASLVLDKAEVQIWPLATATFNGIEETRYTEVPDFDVQLTKVYPSSESYLQIYPGPAVAGTTGEKITDSILLHHSTESRDGTLSFRNFGRHLMEAGVYTIEVVTKTPFGEDVLKSLTFEFDNNILVRGKINTIE